MTIQSIFPDDQGVYRVQFGESKTNRYSVRRETHTKNREFKIVEHTKNNETTYFLLQAMRNTPGGMWWANKMSEEQFGSLINLDVNSEEFKNQVEIIEHN